MEIKFEGIIIAQLFIAFILGAIVGLEREGHGNENAAGIRTYAAVTLGAALFTLIGIHSDDPTASGRIVANIVTGIGFLGAGIMYQDKAKGLTHGLTTASSVWATAAVGVAVAYNLYFIAVAATGAIYFLLALHHFKWYIRFKEKIAHTNDNQSTAKSD
ncbi:MAG: MgtC/SapB family protein [Bacteroidetes bacterium]|nr:MgtC/SapB family protein [Bacteroidota bacterium]